VKWQETGKKCVMKSLIICTSRQMLLWWSEGRWYGLSCSTHEEIRNKYKILVGQPEGKFWWLIGQLFTFFSVEGLLIDVSVML
jgi:hypothetical protein